MTCVSPQVGPARATSSTYGALVRAHVATGDFDTLLPLTRHMTDHKLTPRTADVAVMATALLCAGAPGHCARVLEGVGGPWAVGKGGDSLGHRVALTITAKARSDDHDVAVKWLSKVRDRRRADGVGFPCGGDAIAEAFVHIVDVWMCVHVRLSVCAVCCIPSSPTAPEGARRAVIRGRRRGSVHRRARVCVRRAPEARGGRTVSGHSGIPAR